MTKNNLLKKIIYLNHKRKKDNYSKVKKRISQYKSRYLLNKLDRFIKEENLVL